MATVWRSLPLSMVSMAFCIGFPGAQRRYIVRGAPHAAHGWSREGPHRIVSERSSRNRFDPQESWAQPMTSVYPDSNVGARRFGSTGAGGRSTSERRTIVRLGSGVVAKCSTACHRSKVRERSISGREM